MKRVVLFAAAALMSMCGSALAGTGSITVQLTNYCDNYTLSWNGQLYAILSNSTTCDPGLGGGTAGKVKGMGKLVTTGIILNGSSTEQWVWTFTQPLSKGGTATLYNTLDGKTLNFVTSSPFTVAAGANNNSKLPPAAHAAHN